MSNDKDVVGGPASPLSARLLKMADEMDLFPFFAKAAALSREAAAALALQPVATDEADTTCDNDVGRRCLELWPEDRASWCDGCLALQPPATACNICNVNALRALLNKAAVEQWAAWAILLELDALLNSQSAAIGEPPPSQEPPPQAECICGRGWMWGMTCPQHPTALAAVPSGAPVLPPSVVAARQWLNSQAAPDDFTDFILDEGDCRVCGSSKGKGHQPTSPCAIVASLLAIFEAGEPAASSPGGKSE